MESADTISEHEIETSEEMKVCTQFDQMGLKEELLRGVYSYGFERQSPIQSRGIAPILSGRDIVL
ncbi:MAG: hypothetical protein V2I33_21275 [Kangiellaceae bacterium]|jgi:ATP-dependent RNA helicase|nr:hypothetical protein [Kangiellaceae bacterium]